MDVKPQKIAILCNYELLPERVGGMDCFFWMFDQKCKENNIDVDWFFPNKDAHGDYPKLHIIATNYQEVALFFADYMGSQSQDYSHVIAHFVEICAPVFKRIKQLSKATIIAVDHNPRPVGGYPIRKQLHKKIKGLLYAKYIDTFVGVSEYSKNELLKEFGFVVKKKAQVIFNGLQVEKFAQKKEFNSNSKFVIASHLRKDKGIQDVVEAVRLLQKTAHPFSIDVYGIGPYETALREKITENQLDKFFSFKGSVSNLNELYQHYDYLIHPSHGETFCYAVVEALLSNLPVITNNQGNVLGFVKEGSNGFLYQDGAIEQLSNAIGSILNGTVKIENGLAKAPEVKALSLEKMVDNYFRLIHNDR